MACRDFDRRPSVGLPFNSTVYATRNVLGEKPDNALVMHGCSPCFWIYGAYQLFVQHQSRYMLMISDIRRRLVQFLSIPEILKVKIYGEVALILFPQSVVAVL